MMEPPRETMPVNLFVVVGIKLKELKEPKKTKLNQAKSVRRKNY